MAMIPSLHRPSLATGLAGVAIAAAATVVLSSAPPTPQKRVLAFPDGVTGRALRVSPDGRFAALKTDTEPKARRELRRDLSIVDLSTMAVTRIVAHTATEQVGDPGAWSGDGSRLAYSWCATQEDRRAPNLCEVRSIARDGQGSRTILPRAVGRIEVHHWSPDGQSILLRRSESPAPGRSQLVLLSEADGTLREIKEGPSPDLDDLRCTAPSFSPDGRFVACERAPFTAKPYEATLPGDVILWSLDSGEERVVVGGPADERLVGWTAGNALLFTREDADTVDLWMTTIGDSGVPGREVRLLPGIGSIDAHAVTRDGRLIYSTRPVDAHEVRIATFDPVTGRVLSEPVSGVSGRERYRAPAWSPDGSELAYAIAPGRPVPFYYTDGFDRIATETRATSHVRHLPVSRPGGVADWHLWRFTWSPDSTSLLVWISGGPAAVRGIYRVALTTGEATLLVAGPKYVEGAHATRDGRLVFLREHAEIVDLSLDTGAERVVLDRRQRNWDNEVRTIDSLSMSPDGGYGAFRAVAGSVSTVRIVRIAGGESRIIARLIVASRPSPWDAMTWSADGRFVLYLDRTGPDEGLELWRAGLSGGAPERLGLIAGGSEDLCCLSVHPDGRQLAFAAVRADRAQVFVLDGFLPGGSGFAGFGGRR